jgi:hypothetical protein
MPSETSSWEAGPLGPECSPLREVHPPAFRSSRACVPKELVEAGPAGGGAAESGIHIFLKDLPALAGDVLAKRVKLHVTTLVRRTNSGVNGDDHGV